MPHPPECSRKLLSSYRILHSESLVFIAAAGPGAVYLPRRGHINGHISRWWSRTGSQSALQQQWRVDKALRLTSSAPSNTRPSHLSTPVHRAAHHRPLSPSPPPVRPALQCSTAVPIACVVVTSHGRSRPAHDRRPQRDSHRCPLPAAPARPLHLPAPHECMSERPWVVAVAVCKLGL